MKFGLSMVLTENLIPHIDCYKMVDQHNVSLSVMDFQNILGFLMNLFSYLPSIFFSKDLLGFMAQN